MTDENRDDRDLTDDYHGADQERGEKAQDHDTDHDHGHEGDRPDYDPENVSLPKREPPLRSTAPQSDFTMGQVLTGFAVLVIGLVIVFGLPLALA